MEKTLHILRNPPTEMVEEFIERIAGEDCATVVSLYEDNISHIPVNWCRLVNDIFNHDKVICWW
jgi:hypothetical protein